jgi:hypothetical protein
MSSKIHICNVALSILGSDSIRSFDESNKRSRMCDVFFDSVRDYLLAKFDWPFARSFAKLQQLDRTGVDTPTGVYAYQLPTDCITPRDIFPSGSKDWWEVMGTVLFCKKSSDVYLYYTKREISTGMFSPTFEHLLALGMAVKMGPAIIQDKTILANIANQFNADQRDCWESDANIGNSYRAYDETPDNDSFVNPDYTPDNGLDLD